MALRSLSDFMVICIKKRYPPLNKLSRCLLLLIAKKEMPPIKYQKYA